ncbi:hypothetical protein [Pseudomonas fluorescens]|uniref:hypothetical protein n=1 Tax=Pseudomonas fluorescens TaxID=294 RepID=UPI001C837C40
MTVAESSFRIGSICEANGFITSLTACLFTISVTTSLNSNTCVNGFPDAFREPHACQCTLTTSLRLNKSSKGISTRTPSQINKDCGSSGKFL